MTMKNIVSLLTGVKNKNWVSSEYIKDYFNDVLYKSFLVK